MTVSFELDQSKFQAAAEYVFEQSTRTVPEIINRAALVTIIGGKGVEGAMQRTPKAAREAILAVPVKAVAAYVRKKHSGEKLTSKQFTALVKREYRRRIASIGYTAKVGWNKAAIAFGGRGIGKSATGKGYAAFGSGKLATVGDYTAEFTNTAPAASMIGEQPLQDALDDTALDMVEFWNGKAEEIFNVER